MTSVTPISQTGWTLCIAISVAAILFSQTYTSLTDLKVHLIGLIFSTGSFIFAITPQTFYIIQDNNTVTTAVRNIPAGGYTNDVVQFTFFTVSILVMLLNIVDIILSGLLLGHKKGGLGGAKE